MKAAVAAVVLAGSLCSAVVVPRIPDSSDHQRISTHGSFIGDDYSLNTQLEKRENGVGSIKVTLELVDSGYCGNISIGSQEASILSLFDLSGSQLSALSPNAEHCAVSDQCTPVSHQLDSYDPSHSDTAKDLTQSFEFSTLFATLTGTVYEDSLVIGGITRIQT